MRILKAEGLRKTFGNHVYPTLDDVQIEIAAGESVALVGRSGSGKSTLGRCLTGLAVPDVGHIEWNGPAHRASRQFVHQDPVRAMDPSFSVREVFWEPREIQNARAADAEIEGLIADLIEREGPRSLSGGQAARLALARALNALAAVGEPGLLVLDETLSALDSTLQRETLRSIQSLQTRIGFALVHITHDWELAAATSRRIMTMDEGRLVEDRDHPASRILQDAVLRG